MKKILLRLFQQEKWRQGIFKEHLTLKECVEKLDGLLKEKKSVCKLHISSFLIYPPPPSPPLLLFLQNKSFFFFHFFFRFQKQWWIILRCEKLLIRSYVFSLALTFILNILTWLTFVVWILGSQNYWIFIFSYFFLYNYYNCGI